MNNNAITNSDLQLTARVPESSKELFQELAQKPKDMCAIGNALNVKVSLVATLVA